MKEARTDIELLRAFVESSSESAFTELVQRHIDLVLGRSAAVAGEFAPGARCDPGGVLRIGAKRAETAGASGIERLALHDNPVCGVAYRSVRVAPRGAGTGIRDEYEP